MAPSPRTCCLDHCTIDHRGADCEFTCCDTAVGAYRDDVSDLVEIHANVNTCNADPVPHVCVSVNDHDSIDASPGVARRMAAAILAAADLAEAGALRRLSP